MIEISSLFLLKGYFFMENVHLFIYEKIPAGSFSAGGMALFASFPFERQKALPI